MTKIEALLLEAGKEVLRQFLDGGGCPICDYRDHDDDGGERHEDDCPLRPLDKIPSFVSPCTRGKAPCDKRAIAFFRKSGTKKCFAACFRHAQDVPKTFKEIHIADYLCLTLDLK